MTDHPDRYGLIAGNGKFPLLVLQSARAQGIEVVVAAIKEETFQEIESFGYPVHWLGLGQLGKLIDIFRQAGVRQAIMAGQVKHIQIFSSSLPDFTMIRMLASLGRKNTDSIIGAVAAILRESGIMLADSTALLRPHLATEGAMTRRGLSDHEKSDVEYGRPIAHQVAGMDIGQTVVVRDQAIVAVEAMEGTDAVIRRAGELANRKNLTVIKVSKPKQDMRFDVPVVGVPTIENMIAAGATALVLDGQRTLILDKQRFLELADLSGIAVVGFAPIE